MVDPCLTILPASGPLCSSCLGTRSPGTQPTLLSHSACRLLFKQRAQNSLSTFPGAGEKVQWTARLLCGNSEDLNLNVHRIQAWLCMPVIQLLVGGDRSTHLELVVGRLGRVANAFKLSTWEPD